MEDIDIIYKFKYKSKKAKENAKEEKKEEDEQIYLCHCSFSTEEDCKLTREKIEQFLKSDDVEIPKETIIKYRLKKDNENEIEQNFKELKEPYEDLKLISKSQLELELEIDIDSYLEELEKKEKDKDKEEENEIQQQNKEAEAMLRELSEMRKQIKNIETLNFTNFRNSLNINKKKKNLGTTIFTKRSTKETNSKEEKSANLNPKTEKNQLNIHTSIKLNNSNNENKNDIKNNNIYFFYSFPKDKCQEKNSNDKTKSVQGAGHLDDNVKYFKEDYSFYYQWLYVYKKVKKYNSEKNNPEIKIYLKQIITNLCIEENPIILHIRVDSFLKKENNKNEVYFYYCDDNFGPCEYKLEDLFEKNNENVFKDLKILIISSDNIDLIKNKLDEIENLKNVTKIYIKHPHKQNYDSHKHENESIKEFYDYLIPTEKNKRKDIPVLLKNEKSFNIENIFVKNNNEKSDITEKNLLKYDLILDSYYPLIFRKNELFTYLEKQKHKISICIWGKDEEELKFFIKKIGFSLYERIPQCKVYFLEIYENEIKPNERIYKIDLVFDEIYQNNNEGIIYLIIFFNGINNFQEIKNEINRERIPNEENLIINYLYAFSCKDIKRNNNICDIELGDFLKCEADDADATAHSYNKDEIESLISYYLINQKSELDMTDKLIQNIIEKHSNLKIQNLFLLPIYLKLLSQKGSNNNDNNIKINNNDEKIKQLENLFFEDDINNFVKEIINNNEEYKDIFFYLYILKYGISNSLLGRLWLTNFDKLINYIKTNLIGLIVIENIDNENIYRLNSSFREVIGNILGESNIFKKERFKIILSIYQKIFRQMMPIDFNKITTFNATIKNKFWFTEKSKEKNENEILDEEGDTNYILNEEIDSNNIHYIISTIKNNQLLFDNDLFPYIEDISITLPTLLNYNRNDIYTDLMIQFFEGIFDCNFEQFNNDFKYNIKDIRALNIRLGIFEYWYRQMFECFTKSLERAGIKNKNIFTQLDQLNIETIIECCLIQIYEHIKRKDKNIKTLQDEFNEYIKNIDDKNKNNYIIRFKALCAQCSNSIEEIDNLLNNKKYIKEYEKDLTYIKDDILMHISRFKFYFYLQDPFKSNSNIIDISNNFYLTQKLLNIINKNYDIEYIPFKQDEELKEIQKLNNLLFLYLGNENLFNKLDDNIFKKRIKILILGFFVEEIKVKAEGLPVALKKNGKEIRIEDMHKNGIKNIIYIKNNNNNDNNNSKEITGETWELKTLKSSENFIQKYDLLEKLFFNFIHNFISILVWNDDTTIKKAFTEAKIYFSKNYKYIYEALGVQNHIQIPKLEINMLDTEDKFEVEPFENDDELQLINKESFKFIYDEYEYEDESSKIDNVYYRENPFAKGIDFDFDTKQKEEIINKNVIKLPGIESFKNFNEFINGNIYNKDEFRKLIESIKNGFGNNNVFNLYGNINSQIVDDLCKFFYMEKNFKNGIYIIRQIGSEADFVNFINNIELKDKNKNDLVLIEPNDENKIEQIYKDKNESLVVLDKINNEKLFKNFNPLNLMQEKKYIKFLICSKEQEKLFINGKEFTYTKEEKDLNEKYEFIKSYINSMNII